MKRTTIIEIVMLLTLSLFLYSAISKVVDYTLFKEQLAESPVLKSFAGVIAVSLPIVEFAMVVLLLVPRWRLKGLYSSLIILSIFTIYIVIILLTSDKLPCSCGGLLEQLSWKGHIFFNGVFILLNAIAIRLEKRLKKQHKIILTAAFI
jgi:hypothetical protein